jgi:hypothetical protein
LSEIAAYLRLAKVVREKLGVHTILGLTATAPDATLSDCAIRLGVCPVSILQTSISVDKFVS